MPKIVSRERKEKMIQLRENGYTYQEIGNIFHLTKQAVHLALHRQVPQKHIPRLETKLKLSDVKKRIKKGTTISQLAREYGVCYTSLRTYCLRHDMTLPIVLRKQGKVKPFPYPSKYDVYKDRISALLARKKTPYYIAKALDIPFTSLLYYIKSHELK